MAIRKKNGWNEEDTRLTNKMRKKGDDEEQTRAKGRRMQ